MPTTGDGTTVYEAGLPALNEGETAGTGEIADGIPNNNSDIREATSGTITFSTPDGFGSLSITTSDNVTTLITGPGQLPIQTPQGTFTITGFNPTAGTLTYTYTLKDNLLTSGDSTTDVLTVTVKDSDGDSDAKPFTITIIDDRPTAVADVDFIASGSNGPVTGNVLDATEDTVAEDANGTDGVADIPGADGAKVVGVVAGNTNADLDDPLNTLGKEITGLYGKLMILNENGDYTYSRNDGSVGNVSDVFTYTIKDGDGDLAHTTLTINIGNSPVRISNLTPAEEGGDVTVDEDDLPAGSDTSKEALTQTGTFNISAPDGVKTLVIGGATVINNGVFAAATITTPLGNTLNILNYIPETGLITYSYTLAAAETHANANGENALFENFTVTLTDTDLDTISDTLSVRIIDDLPLAVNDTATQSPENAPVTVDVFANDVQRGADGTLASSVALVAGSQVGSGTLVNNGNGTFTLTPLAGQTGQVTFQYTITDADGDTSQATVTITLADDSLPQVVNVVAAVDDDGLAGANAAANATDIDANVGDLDGLLSSEASFRGQINVNFGGDTPGSVSFANLAGTFVQVGTERVLLTWSGTLLTGTVAATDASSVAQARSGTELFTVGLTTAGAYTVTLKDNVLHATGGDEASAPVVDLFYRATDSDNDVVETGKLSVTFNDDVPIGER